MEDNKEINKLEDIIDVENSFELSDLEGIEIVEFSTSDDDCSSDYSCAEFVEESNLVYQRLSWDIFANGLEPHLLRDGDIVIMDDAFGLYEGDDDSAYIHPCEYQGVMNRFAIRSSCEENKNYLIYCAIEKKDVLSKLIRFYFSQYMLDEDNWGPENFCAYLKNNMKLPQVDDGYEAWLNERENEKKKCEGLEELLRTIKEKKWSVKRNVFVYTNKIVADYTISGLFDEIPKYVVLEKSLNELSVSEYDRFHQALPGTRILVWTEGCLYEWDGENTKAFDCNTIEYYLTPQQKREKEREAKIEKLSTENERLNKENEELKTFVDQLRGLQEKYIGDDKLVDKIAEEVVSKGDLPNNASYLESTDNQLREILGTKIWDGSVLESSTKKFLQSSMVMYKRLADMGEEIDFSGVCCPAVKALEVELGKFLCTDYIAYLKDGKFAKNESEKVNTRDAKGNVDLKLFPPSLWNLQNKDHLMSANDFTLGNATYILHGKKYRFIKHDLMLLKEGDFFNSDFPAYKTLKKIDEDFDKLVKLKDETERKKNDLLSRKQEGGLKEKEYQAELKPLKEELGKVEKQIELKFQAYFNLNQERIVSYLRARLSPEYLLSLDENVELQNEKLTAELAGIGSTISYIAVEYRNKICHTGEIPRDIAEKCLSSIIGVENGIVTQSEAEKIIGKVHAYLKKITKLFVFSEDEDKETSQESTTQNP